MKSNRNEEAWNPNMTKVSYRECKICGFVGKNAQGFSLHLSQKHKIDLLDYAEQYEGFERPKCIVCGEPARYKGDHYKGRHAKKGFLFYATCSDECRAKNIGDKHRGVPDPKHSESYKKYWANTSEERRQQIIENRVVGIAKVMKNGGTYIENIIADELKMLNIRYERQKRVGQYIVDFYLIGADIYLEIDGCYWHGCKQCGFDGVPGIQEKAPRQRRRTGYFKSRGFRVERIPEHDITNNLDAVRELLKQWATPREGTQPPVETEREAPLGQRMKRQSELTGNSKSAAEMTAPTHSMRR